MVRMDKDSNTRKRKKSIDDNTRNCKKSQWTRNGSGSEEEDEDLFSWEEYLQKCHAKAVPKETFKHVQDTKVQGFVPGMKLECLDRSSLETDTYWVATVIMASGPLLLLRYDGYDDDRSGDFWCDAASEELQPIGWSARTNNILIPPSAIRHKASNWAKFLMQDLKGAVYAPEHLFHDRSDPEEENQLKPGLKLEVLNRDNPVTYWIVSVVDAYGLRLRLRHEGSQDEAHDVWVYFLSDCVHQLGWGKKNDLTLKVPTGLKARHADKDWPQVRERLLSLCQCSSEDASLNKSLQKTNNPLKPHGFTTGMKLEAVNPKDPSSICAATVSKVPNKTFFQVEIDSLISCGDGSRPSMWCNSSSKNIFPVGWCEKNSIQLTPPPGYLVHPFRWQTYFEWTNSSAAPDTLFTLEVPPHTFEIGMKLEAVDQTNPSTMTVATVTQVVGRTVWVLLDGYKNDSLEHIYDVESYDLYPAGWCSMNGHPLLTPRVQRPQEENRRLASLRTRQRETKKTAVTSDTTNTTSTTSTVNTTSKTNTTVTTSKVPTTTSTNTTNITKTTNTATRVSSTMSTDTSTTNKTTNTTSTTNTTKTTDTTSTANSDQSTSATTNKADTPQVGKEATVHEGIKQEGGLTDQRSPVKGPYDLRASTLMPRDYVSQMGPTEDDPVEEKKNVEAVIDLTGEEEEVTDKTVKPPPAAKEPVPAGALVKNELGICIYVRKTCEPGPFLKQSRLAVIPPVIGPAGANVVLRQLVEQIVLSAHSSKQVLKLLAAETDKMTIASILKTLRTKLSLCENLISLHRVALCAHCDASRLSSISPSQNLRKNSGPQAAGALEISKPTVPLKTAVPRENNKTAARPEKATAPRVNSEPATRPEAAVPQANSVPTARTERVAPLLNREPATTVPRVNSEPVAGPKRVDPRVSLKPGGPLENAVQKITREQEKTTTNSPARTTKHITQWNVKEVVDFIRTSDCRTFAEEFQKQEIDGRVLTLLSLDEIHKCLGVTLGPAIKLHFAVQKLRKKHR